MVSSSAVSLSPAPPAASAIATAARLSGSTGSLSGSRVKATQSEAIFRLVASLNGLIVLDYTTAAPDEMTLTSPGPFDGSENDE